MVVTQPVGLAVEGEHHAAVQQPIQEGGRNGGVAQDFAPRPYRSIGRQHDRGFQISLGDNLKQCGRGLVRQRQIPELVDLCRYRHRSIYADLGNMPTCRARRVSRRRSGRFLGLGLSA